MRMRLEATTRSPASSSIRVMAPVRLRRVASGLMIEKVRVTAMTGRSPVLGLVGFDRPPSRASPPPQPSRLLHPFAALMSPVAALDLFASGKRLPCLASALQRHIVEQDKAAVVR